MIIFKMDMLVVPFRREQCFWSMLDVALMGCGKVDLVPVEGWVSSFSDWVVIPFSGLMTQSFSVEDEFSKI